jgi:hypothetical protein
MPTSFRWIVPALVLGAAAGLMACAAASEPALPSFPDYAPAAPFLAERQRVEQQRAAQEVFQAQLRADAERRSYERSNEIWRRLEQRREELRRLAEFQQGHRQVVHQYYFDDLTGIPKVR